MSRGVRGQLGILVAATTSLVLIAFLVPLGLLLRRTAEERAISAATQQAQTVAALVSLNQDPALGEVGDGGARISVFYPDGRVVGAPAARTSSVELAARGQAFTAEAGNGVDVLVPVQGLPGGAAVVLAQVPESVLHEGVARTWTLLTLLGLGLLAVGLVVADRLGRRMVASVTDLAAAADRLAGGDLSGRVTPSGPRELQRVGVAMNTLARRIGELLAGEREEVADLAHRLRTPATALRLNVDSLTDADERARLEANVDALARAVDEVIRTARRPVTESAGQAADLARVAAERVAFWSALAEDTGRLVETSLPGVAVRVRASSDDVIAALDALLENVFAHTPDRAALRVAVRPSADGGGSLVVEDAGPGLPSGLVAQRGVSGRVGSTGLGLDIARRTAEAAGGSMVLGVSSLGGARVELTFGPPE